MKRATLVLVCLAAACQPSVKEIKLQGTPPLPASGALPIHAAGPAVILAATALSDKGKTIKGVHIAFQSSDPKIATVDPKGVVTAVKSGAVTISAKSDQVHQDVSLAISIPSRLDWCPSAKRSGGRCPATAGPLTTAAGHRVDMSLAVLDDNGHLIEGGDDKSQTFSSANPSIATVDEKGRIEAHAPGQATLSAHSGSVSTTLALKVTPPDFEKVEIAPKVLKLRVGETKTLAASGKSKRITIPDLSVVWSSSSQAVAAVSGSGTVKGIKKGKASIVANAGGKTAKVAVVVK